ncbi:putative cytokinetic ring protein SteA [Corynebacterium sp. sy039]|uniref:putative cytokinetic ring protein SteA n=1 Tax=Corynebacterium sp. sy039 TaxID=2599641 RepID=UPI0011B831BD|nr:putative cytokinetic ring protein SteA [Corynebacterium sp. sy039]QDZ42559.1 thiamine pyrophosphokinase [Corynebacterium sp. sy039]
MGSMSLFSRTSDIPGISGTARDCRATSKGLKKFAAGDIAVIDCPDISRSFAQYLIDEKPIAVVNTAQFSTGAIPNFGPQMLLEAGIVLVEGVGKEIWSKFKDGKKILLTEQGELLYGDKTIAAGNVLELESADKIFVDAQQSLTDHMEAYFGNTIQFIQSEAPLLIDGLGIPDSGKFLAHRKVLVVSPGAGFKEQLDQLRNFIREYEPAIIAVDSAADTLVDMGYTPELIVGDPSGIGAEALRSGAQVILPAEPDGHAAGLDRIQDLGIGAMTFPAAIDSATDLALLLADYHGAELIVNAGAPLDLDAIFAGKDSAMPSSLITRTKLGEKLVDASAISHLYTVRSSAGVGWLWAFFGLLVLVAVIILIAGLNGNGSFVDNLIDTWNNIAVTVQGFFK